MGTRSGGESQQRALASTGGAAAADFIPAAPMAQLPGAPVAAAQEEGGAALG
jgi:PAB1-binding protein PBP1